MNAKTRFLTGGLAMLMVIALFPAFLRGANEKSEPQPLTGWTDNSQIQSGLVTQQMGQMPLAFTKNEGQWDEQALFRANAGGATMWFTREGTYYQFTRRIAHANDSGGGRQMSTPPLAGSLTSAPGTANPPRQMSDFWGDCSISEGGKAIMCYWNGDLSEAEQRQQVLF